MSYPGPMPARPWEVKLPFYYGWVVLGASALIELLMTGATAYAAGLFVLPLEKEFGLSRADASSPVLLLYLGAALCGPVAGRMLDRFPSRPVMCLGTLLFCGALLAIAGTSSLGLMAVMLMVPAALGYLVLGMLNSATLASRWFMRHRGLALGIAAVATSGGGLISPLLAELIARHGWRAALVYEAAIFGLVVLVLTLVFIRDDPAALGLQDHPEIAGRPEQPTAPPQPTRGFAAELGRWRRILMAPEFWAPSLIVATVLGISQSIVTAAVPYGVQLGYSATRAALCIFAFTLAAVATKILAGILSDLIDKRLVLLIAAASMMAALSLLCLSRDFNALVAACALAGLAQGTALPTASALIAARFGAQRFGATMGWTYCLIGVLTIAAVRISGTLFDRSGAHLPSFQLFLGFCAAMALIALAFEILLVRRGAVTTDQG